MNPKLIMTLVKLANSKEGKALLQKMGSGLTTEDEKELKMAEKNGIPGLSSGKSIYEIAMGSPIDYAIKGLTEAGSAALNIFGNQAQNNSNRLASALLKRGRVNNEAQENLYGLSTQDKMNEAVAENIIRKGNNKKIFADETNRALRNISNMYENRSNTARMMEAADNTELPGAFFNYANGVQSRANRATKGDR